MKASLAETLTETVQDVSSVSDRCHAPPFGSQLCPGIVLLRILAKYHACEFGVANRNGCSDDPGAGAISLFTSSLTASRIGPLTAAKIGSRIADTFWRSSRSSSTS